MADKSQTINIVYKFNTTEIDKHTQAVKRANDATNKLQQDASKMGQAGSKGTQDWSKSIAGLEANLQRLAFRAKNAANPADAKKWGEAWGVAKKQLDETNKSVFGLGKAASEAQKGMGGLVTEFRNLSKFAGLAIIAGIGKEVVDLTLSMSTLQGQVEGVERGFNRAFTNPVEILNQVREATHGTITDFDLMKRTLQATNLGVGVEHLGTLFEFAAARAQQTGESVDYLVDSIVRGIGRKSPLVLDNLGISVTALKEKFNGASIASKTVAEATEGVAEIAREQLEKMGGYLDTAETRVKAFGVSWENVRIAFAKKIDATGLIQFFTDVNNGLTDIIKGGEVLQQESAKSAAATRLAALLDDDIFKDKKKNQIVQLDLLAQELVQTTQLIRLKDKEIAQFEKALTSAEKAVTVDELGNVVQKENITFREKAIASLKIQRQEYQALVPMIANALRILQSEMDLENTHVETLEEMSARLKDMKDAFRELADRDDLIAPSAELKQKAEDIKQLEKEIEQLESLLKDPKQLKIKVKFIEDDLGARAQKFFDEGGGLKDTKFNPVTGAVFDEAAKNATETIDIDKMMDFEQSMDPFEEAALKAVGKSADKISGEFWTRLRLAFKREGSSNSELQESLEDALREVENMGIDILASQLDSLVSVDANAYDARIRQAKDFYEQQAVLAGNNEQAKDRLRLLEDKKVAKLRRDNFIADQKAAKARAIIDGAAAIVKTFANVGFPAAAILAVGLAAATASQIAIIDRQQPRFAKGVINLQGRGTGTSDSIPARLSKGESVMTAWETKNSGGILKEIRARKLDDRVLRNMREGRQPVMTPMSDAGIIKAIKDNKPADVIEQSGIVYKVTRKSDDYILKQRAKSVKI